MAVKRNKTIFCKEITNYDPNAYGCVEGRAIEKEIFNKKECDCALQHIKAFQEQAVKGQRQTLENHAKTAFIERRVNLTVSPFCHQSGVIPMLKSAWSFRSRIYNWTVSRAGFRRVRALITVWTRKPVSCPEKRNSCLNKIIE